MGKEKSLNVRLSKRSSDILTEYAELVGKSKTAVITDEIEKLALKSTRIKRKRRKIELDES